MHLKTFLGAVLSTALFCAAPIVQTTAEAAKPYDCVSPLYEIAYDHRTALSISGSKATCKSSVESNDAVKITGEQYLQKQDFLWFWNTYDNAEWTETVNASNIAMINEKTGLTSGKYRLKTVFKLTDKQGKTETITVYSDEKSV